jgi:hypothetical protein
MARLEAHGIFTLQIVPVLVRFSGGLVRAAKRHTRWIHCRGGVSPDVGIMVAGGTWCQWYHEQTTPVSGRIRRRTGRETKTHGRSERGSHGKHYPRYASATAAAEPNHTKRQTKPSRGLG